MKRVADCNEALDAQAHERVVCDDFRIERKDTDYYTRIFGESIKAEVEAIGGIERKCDAHYIVHQMSNAREQVADRNGYIIQLDAKCQSYRTPSEKQHEKYPHVTNEPEQHTNRLYDSVRQREIERIARAPVAPPGLPTGDRRVH